MAPATRLTVIPGGAVPAGDTVPGGHPHPRPR
jgi:hypothetical protein